MRFLLCALLLSSAFAFVDLGKHGKTYPVVEEDFYEQILSKIREAKPRVFLPSPHKLARVHIPLPEAREERWRKLSLSMTLPRDIVIGGRSLAKKGQKLTVPPIGRVYVFLKPKHIPAFMDLAKRYDTMFLLTEGNVLDARNRYPDLLIYPALPLLVKRLYIQRVPSLVYMPEAGTLVVVEVPWEYGRVRLPF